MHPAIWDIANRSLDAIGGQTLLHAQRTGHPITSHKSDVELTMDLPVYDDLLLSFLRRAGLSVNQL
jgi:hypothetical protein